jgi:hypothetical protein
MTTEIKKFVLEYTEGYTLDSFPPELHDIVNNCHHMGRCDVDVENAAHYFEVDKPSELRKYLKEFGAWDEEELKNDVDNLHRLLFLMAGDIQEQGEFIFSH